MYQNIFITSRTEEEGATVYVWDDTDGLLTFPYSEFAYAYKRDRSGDKETIFGDKVSKTYRFGENQPGIFESDVPRETRVLTDLYLNSDDIAKNHKALIFDLEVSSDGGFASVERAEKKITAIGCYAQADDQYIVFMLDEQKRLTEKQIGNELILVFETEQELLEAFMAFYSEYKPTILSGWNICQYDVPYLFHRLKNVFDEDTANMLSPIGMMKYNKMRRQYQIAGVSCLDYFEMYQKFTFARRPSYRLGAIGMYEVNMDKIAYDGSLDKLFEDDPQKFIEYNLQDVRIVVALDKKMKLIDLVKNISHVGHTQYEDYKYSSKYIEGTILVYLHRQGRVVPNKRAEGRAEFEQKLEEDDEGFSGAYVQEPTPGLYEWVYNLDLQSLYPSIIMSLNISPETKVGYVKNWNLEQHAAKKAGQYIVEVGSVQNVLDREQFMQFMQDEKFMLSSNGILYRSDKLGIIPEILDKWFAERVEYKNLMKKHKKEGNEELADYYDKRQHVQKILLNSIYGVLGLPIFRFYDLDNALAVTATGQDVIKTTSKLVNLKYRKTVDEKIDRCIYIDTDSVYFPAQYITDSMTDEEKIEATVKEAREMESVLNDKYYDLMAKQLFFCDKHRFVIKGEAVSKRAFWVAKKRYAMWKVYDLESNIPLETPKLKVTGLDVVRSSFPPAFQKFMSKVLDSLLNKVPKTEIDEMILQFRKDMNGMEFKEVAINTSVKNISEYDEKKEKGLQHYPKGCPAHVKAAIAYNRWLRINKMDKKFESIRNNDKIKWVYLKDNPLKLPTMALRGYDDPPELTEFVQKYLDYEAAFENGLKNKLEDFYNAQSWGKLPTDMNQAAERFFSF
jgi:DNA polymerase elongation subunit (family B)